MDGMGDIFSTYMSFLYLTKINFNKKTKKNFSRKLLPPDKSPWRGPRLMELSWLQAKLLIQHLVRLNKHGWSVP